MRANPSVVDRFIPCPDVSERHEVLVHAPAALVFDVAAHFDLQSLPLVRAIFWLRTALMRSKAASRWSPTGGLVSETTAMGWGTLASEPGRLHVAGAVAEPWLPDVRFRPIPPEQFASFAEPGLVKIVWTIECEALEPVLTRFRTDTRVAATDAGARTKFRAYWRKAGIGILLIRWLLLPAVRRQSERRFRNRHAAGASGAAIVPPTTTARR